MRTRSKNKIFVAEERDEDGGLARRGNAKMRLDALRQKRKEREREMAVPLHPPPKRQWLRPPMPSSLPPREVDMSTLEFLFEKKLKHSDVKDRGRVVIPQEYALEHFPQLDAKEGIFMSMDDVTTPKLWTFRYGFWSNNNGRIHVLEHACEFFAMHGLKNGDFIMFYVDRQLERFAIGSRKANVDAGPGSDDQRVLEGAKMNENLAYVASASGTGAMQSSVGDEDDDLEKFLKEFWEDDDFDLPKM